MAEYNKTVDEERGNIGRRAGPQPGDIFGRAKIAGNLMHLKI